MPEGKIIKALSGFYYVLSDDGTITQCRGRGVFRKNKITPLVGDNVVYQAENETEGYILEVIERHNELIRPPIANVDQAVLVFSAVEPEFSTLLLDRFLVLVESSEIKPIICISKTDLTTSEEMHAIQNYASIYRKIGYEVILSSTKEKDSLYNLQPHLNNQISVIAGQSGVGKSSLLNVLRPDLDLKTDDISTSLGRGKHTTRHVELIQIGEGYVADTPGFSSLEFLNIEAGELSYCFPEIYRIGAKCKFRGCTHTSEPKCAVIEALSTKEIEQFRYNHYQSFFEEIKDRKPRY
ncbi:ribosome small subunit-dependent GTPase A [Fredinandcohnia quinoae]|uniref:Small ribosomal subunit biogenesis GTPase RsgA n=1 Tax=Fredinandcohnia quinoae TaxID=2918902 RepID=A0AAW5DTX0_9BACI|nr:ribosome small subunit-dependent GTPase A [Fredinandcohnia sp. SECRCQ15]MCH1623828.1 ribosome small subunit-dependent GTPase A [Fredinandcohnia sp. SECRCQ15]